MKQLSFLLFGLLLLLAACGSGSSSSSDAKGDEKNSASESGSVDQKTYKIKLLSIHL